MPLLENPLEKFQDVAVKAKHFGAFNLAVSAPSPDKLYKNARHRKHDEHHHVNGGVNFDKDFHSYDDEDHDEDELAFR